MRVCFVSRRFFPAISGMSVYALNLVRQLVDQGHDVVMVSQYRGDDAGVAVYGGGPPPPIDGAEVVGLESLGEQQINHDRPADFEADLDAMVQAICDAHQEKPLDLIHAQYAYPTGLAALEASRRLGVPNLVSIQGGDGHWVGLCCDTHRDAMAAVLANAGDLLIGSKSFAQEVHENHGTALDRFTIVPGATDTERFRPRDVDAIGELSDPPTFIYHGRVDRRKGMFEMVRAMEMVLRKIPNAKMIISGIGPDSDSTQALIDEMNLSDAITMTGYADYENAPSVYHRGEIFVSPTYSEGFSNTILEAMASGLPVVSTDTVGVVDCLSHEINGLLVPIETVEPLADAMLRMVSDHDLRRRLAMQGYRDVMEKYSWPVIGSTIIDRYHAALKQPIRTDWTDVYDPQNVSVATADLSCRFRTAPHLL